MLKAELPDWAEVNEVAVDIARERAADLLVGASKTKKKVIRSLIRRALDQGWTDAELRRRIAEKAGLDPRSAQALENYRAGLKEAKVPPGRTERLVAAYRKRLLKARARLIATTETQQALMDAQRELWARMREAGDVSPYAVRVTVTHKDDRLCPTCRPEGGRRRSLKRGSGGGPPFHPSCRCYEVLSDQGVVKASPDGSTLYVEGPIGVLDHHTHGPNCTCRDCKKKRAKWTNDGRLTTMDDVIKADGRNPYCMICSQHGNAPFHETNEHDAVSKGRLNWSPKENWVDKVGGLPKYIEDIAVALIRDHGMPRSRAIAIAVSRVKMWARGGGDVNADTRAKAAKAVAEWEAKKARAKAKDYSK